MKKKTKKKVTKSNSDVVNEAIADAKAMKKLMVEKAKDELFETFNDRIRTEMQNVFEEEDVEDTNTVVEGEEIDEETVEETVEEGTEGDKETVEEGDNPFADKDEEDEEVADDEETVEEGEDEEVADDVAVGADEEMEDDEEEIDIEEILREIEDEMSDSEEDIEDVEDLGDEEVASEEEVASDEFEAEDDEDLDFDIEDDEVAEEEFEAEADEEEIEESLGQKVDRLQTENDEFKSIIDKLSGSLKEVNLMNTKLGYVQKLATKYDISTVKPDRLLEQFDKAKTVREVKLTYSLLAENFKSKEKVNKIKAKLTETVTVKKKVKKETLNEDVNTPASIFDSQPRWQKLAGIKKSQ